MAAGDGTPIVVTRPDRAQGELNHSWPEMLPGGRAVLFTIIATTGGLDAAQVAVLDLQGGTRTVLVRGGNLVPTGALMRVGVERSESWEATAPARLLKVSLWDG